MKHKHKVQILSLGLALALSQAANAFAAGTVTVGLAPGETAQTSVAETNAAQSSATETSAAQKTSESSAAQSASETAASQNGTSQAVSQTPGTSHTVTAGNGVTSDRPAVLPAAGQTPVAVLDAILNLGPGTAASNSGTAVSGNTSSKTVSAGNENPGTATNNQDSATQSTASAADIKQPEVAAEGAVLLNAATGEVLYGKNQDQQFYPASITKVMTALVVLEHCNLNDTVTFSETATTNLESGAVALGVSAGDQLTVEQSLYGLLLKSANEIGNGLAEHVSGSVSAFADLMNAKAKELGCKNTHFANPHGLNNENHKTTPYDMALILRAAVANDTFRKIDTTTSYEFPAIKNAAAHTITMGHKMMYKTDSRYYEGIIGGKTGYTSKAGNTLVTAVERDGVRLIAVVMKAKGTHYTDTKAMLDYGFQLHAAGKI
ncbi:D-alanyl-D-alanine carboxypeptidase family protein [Clostridium sp. AF32-12BH]|uniref:D-alanyl-D-alanine carboxypeptidase family protein n=1 Tax=Clostridium sp. AF32-12BH TaxID=2292006 RepID=UPI000E4DE54A|nr:D-alanyl-D-alanine carboxypeptidase [Clostridium sp. AF32-12BH]